ncbi:DUF4357 domain-containing protein [Streptomyces sp. NPDC047821]|uniref:DUF4357 domain-containing protein n=1 Tax=Streptomyces sp. NPDC047821 TaxID=3365488 RepID=UPI003719580D
MTDAYPELYLRLPRNGPEARGRLLGEKGARGSQKFVIVAGSPAQVEEVASFRARKPTSYRTRRQLVAEGALRRSERWQGYLEAARDIECTSPTAAAEILRGCSVNGWGEWKSADGQPLARLDHLSTAPNRAWLIRGSHVLGVDLVQRLWIAEGLVSVAASRLRQGVEENPDRELLRTLVEEDYESATYNTKRELVEALHTFLTRMKPDDTVCTLSDGQLYVGKVTGAAEQIVSEDGRSNLRRPVDWQATRHTWEELPEELRQKLKVQHDVVDLTAVQALIDGLGLTDDQLADEAEATVSSPGAEPPALTARRPLELPEPDQSLADRLHVHTTSWLSEVRDLLRDDKQLVFYGPPGTGKTHLALELAKFFGGGPEQVKLVQFHPSYSYEDFFEGYRPREDAKTQQGVAFRLTAGPLRELADRAGEEGNRHVPHFLIIDEINRANLAKVFGELYFLLEYRSESLRLTYSGDDFSLPDNLFVIGTMNTADRSIALVDAAMRRRFAFVELSPRTEPTRGLLRRWLKGQGKEPERADLLDELNSRIDDADFRIGPAYLMKPGVDREGGLERTWQTKILPLLEEHHYGEGADIEKRYGLTSLRAALAAREDESRA